MYSSSFSEDTPLRSDRPCVPGKLVEVPVLYDRSYKPDTLFDVPVLYQFDSDDSEETTESVSEADSESKQKSEAFNFVLPTDFVPLDDDEDTQVPSVEDKTRLPLAQRLKGWEREIRRRSNGRLDIEQWVLDQPNPREEGALSPPDTNLQMQEEEGKQEKRPRLKTEIVELSEPFNFLLPTDYVSILDDDEEIQKLSNGDVKWLPLAQRLKGWIRETRCRSSGRLDFFYYHKGSGEKQYRSFRDVKRYIYLGFFPSAENGNKYLDQWVFDQPNPREEGAPLASAT